MMIVQVLFIWTRRDALIAANSHEVTEGRHMSLDLIGSKGQASLKCATEKA